jgi:predicted nucleotidyltransferase
MERLHKNIMKNFADDTRKILKDNLVAEYLFGSVARNQTHEYSDIDILIIVRHFDYQIRKDLSKLSSEYSLNHGVCISPVIKDIKIWRQNQFYKTLFYQQIQWDGMRLC